MKAPYIRGVCLALRVLQSNHVCTASSARVIVGLQDLIGFGQQASFLAAMLILLSRAGVFTEPLLQRIVRRQADGIGLPLYILSRLGLMTLDRVNTILDTQQLGYLDSALNELSEP